MALTFQEAGDAREWTARPNRSLDPAARRGLIGGLLAMTVLVSVGFMLAGAWMVLPFAGLELIALGLALRAVARSDDAYETIRLEAGRLSVTAHRPHGDFCASFHPFWVRVSLESDGTDRAPLLCLRSHGRQARVGHLMTPDQRRTLATELRGQLQQLS